MQMKRKVTYKENWLTIQKYKKRFLKQKQFPALLNPYEDRMEPVLHTGYLIFIRGKFLFLGILKSIEDRNMYVFYSLLKSYWENVAALGYYYSRVSLLLQNRKVEE